MNRICLRLRILLYLWTSLFVWLRNVVPLGETGFSLAIEEESVPSGFINSFLLYVVGCNHTRWLQSFSSWKWYSVHKNHSIWCGLLQWDFLNCKGSHFIWIRREISRTFLSFSFFRNTLRNIWVHEQIAVGGQQFLLFGLVSVACFFSRLAVYEALHLLKDLCASLHDWGEMALELF